MVYYGFDTANTVTQSLASGAVNQFGNGYWLRYLSPSPYANVMNSSQSTAVAECQAMYDNGARRLAVLSEPYQSRLETTGSTGASYGTADATTFVNKIIWLWRNVGNLDWPSSDQVYCYLAMEQSTTISSAYWDHWADYINTYNFNVAGNAYPFYPSLYCSPNYSNGCNVFANSGGWAIWSSAPEYCSYCGPFGPSWNADHCTGYPTYFWQYAEHDVCANCGYTFNRNVDLDAANPNYSVRATMFSFSGRPY